MGYSLKPRLSKGGPVCVARSSVGGLACVRARVFCSVAFSPKSSPFHLLYLLPSPVAAVRESGNAPCHVAPTADLQDVALKHVQTLFRYHHGWFRPVLRPRRSAATSVSPEVKQALHLKSVDITVFVIRDTILSQDRRGLLLIIPLHLP
ncbi:hypothetical protein RJT34_33375 [Clitoria ternatea]|uniref:Uncharacterized protein n=1 Tax=Clitoria ternatea TaxID=43366 RepID=A0AAN9EY28_CLITE